MFLYLNYLDGEKMNYTFWARASSRSSSWLNSSRGRSSGLCLTGDGILAVQGGGGEREGVFGIMSICWSASGRHVRPILPCLLMGIGGLTSGTILELKSRDGNIAINVMGLPTVTPSATITTRMIAFALSKAEETRLASTI